MDHSKVSFVMPAKNEAAGLKTFLPELKQRFPNSEIIVVNDGSTDDTQAVSESLGAKVVSHPYSKGNGAAIKTGARAATHPIIVFLDADGQHRPEDALRLLERLDEGHDMVIGARDRTGQASVPRLCANTFYNKFASWVTEVNITDLTSGFRAVRAEKFKQFLYLYPNGFSYPTTSTLAFIRVGYSVCFEPIQVQARIGTSHIRLYKDGVRFLLILFKIGTLYAPLKIFLPAALTFFGLGSLHYLDTFINEGRFTNMSALLYSFSALTFLMGLISEQITTLTYQKFEELDNKTNKT